MAHRPTRLAAACAGLALMAGPAALALAAGPAAGADAGDWTPLDRDAPIADVTSDIPAPTITGAGIGDRPDYDVGLDDPGVTPQVGDVAADDPAMEEQLIGDVDTAPGEDIIDAPDIGEVPETGEVGREKDPVPDTLEPLPERRGFEY